MIAVRQTANRSGSLLHYVLLLLAAPVVWSAMYWLFDIPLASRLNSSTSIVTAFGLDSPAFVRNLLFAGLIYPILEEIVFRGALQGFLLSRMPSSVSVSGGNPGYRNSPGEKIPSPDNERRFMLARGVSYANLLTSIVFAAMHLISQSPLWAFLIFFPSLAFGWAREASGGLLVPILLHVVYNMGFFVLFFNS